MYWLVSISSFYWLKPFVSFCRFLIKKKCSKNKHWKPTNKLCKITHIVNNQYHLNLSLTDKLYRTNQHVTSITQQFIAFAKDSQKQLNNSFQTNKGTESIRNNPIYETEHSCVGVVSLSRFTSMTLLIWRTGRYVYRQRAPLPDFSSASPNVPK